MRTRAFAIRAGAHRAAPAAVAATGRGRCDGTRRCAVGSPAGPPRSPLPGYRHAYLGLVDERWRERLERLFDAEFERAPAAEDAPTSPARGRCVERISEPLTVSASAN